MKKSFVLIIVSIVLLAIGAISLYFHLSGSPFSSSIKNQGTVSNTTDSTKAPDLDREWLRNQIINDCKPQNPMLINTDKNSYQSYYSRLFKTMDSGSYFDPNRGVFMNSSGEPMSTISIVLDDGNNIDSNEREGFCLGALYLENTDNGLVSFETLNGSIKTLQLQKK